MYIKRHPLSIGLLVSSLTLVASILSTNANAATYYISPTGSNSSAGASSSAPWKTFSFAIPKLRPGDTLTLLDGTYTFAVTGLPQFSCDATLPIRASNGTAALPITLRAVNERQAHLVGGGLQTALRVIACSYWTFEGLYLSGANTPTNAQSDGSTVTIRNGSHHITFRRNLIFGNNRYLNSHGVNLWDVHQSLFEENELYSMHRHGFMLFGSTPAQAPSFNVFRRNYLHSHAAADISGGYISNPTNRGDAGISCYPCNNTIFENNISEGWSSGFDIMAKGNAINNRYYGDIALSNQYGWLLKARDDWPPQTIDDMPRNTLLTNVAAIATAGPGIYARGNKNTICTNCTLIDATGAGGIGFNADVEAPAIGDGKYTVSGSNVLVANNANAPFRLVSQTSPLFNEVVVFGNGAAVTPAIPNAAYTNVSTTNPALGTCKVFIPAASPASGTGVGGADIGANILYRYQDGVLTTTPLWDPATGKFPCGAIVPGVNDSAGSSCFDVHKRLNVNTNGCMLPTAVSLLPTNLRMVGSPQ